MKSNYKPLGEYIKMVDIRNTDNIEAPLLGVSVQKKFIPYMLHINDLKLVALKEG